MSLLLDALKRAEQEKLARRGDRGGADIGREAANAPLATPPPASLELQSIGPPPAAATPRSEASAHAAQVVFAAKTAARADVPKAKSMVWVTVAMIVVVVAAVAAYVWYSINALAPTPAATARARLAPVAQPPDPSPPAQSSPGPFSLIPPPLPPPAPTTAPASGRLTLLEPAPAARKAPEPAVRQPMAQQVLAQSSAAAAPPLRLARTADAPRVPGEVASGYSALQTGNLAAARRSYQSAIASDAANVDAQLGLATVEARQGNRGAAALHYRKALEADSRNATALAGLASLADFSRPEQLESQLREDIVRYPQSAPLRFALGNVYAAQGRWREAQSEYFEAHRLDPGGADILYNLAVSLDNLGQKRPASDYYARALDAARRQAAQFDAGTAARRLAELAP